MKPGAPRVIRVLLADDHTIVREGLRELLADAPDLSIEGDARDFDEVMQRVRGGTFDVLVLDLSMPGGDGVELIKRVHAERPELYVLVLSMHTEEKYAVRSIRAGASGYLTKESATEQLVSAIRKVANGGAFISEAVARQLAAPEIKVLPHTALSDREFQVFLELIAGRSVTDIAAALKLSVKTVSTHKTHIVEKMGMSNRTELVYYAIHHGLADDPRKVPR